MTRELILALAVASGVYVVVVTELLSLFEALTATWIRGLWIAYVLGLAIVVFRMRSKLVRVWRGMRLSIYSLAVLGGLGLLIALSAVVAWSAPPNTSDSLSYHMSRVANWAQRQSVADYSTPTILQLYLQPWAEFAILQLQLLVQSDRLANLVQYTSMLVSMVATSFAARMLGGGALAQLLTAVFVATLPMGILQSTSTQNDYVEAMWLSIFTAGVVLIWTHRRPSIAQYAWCGGSLGLALCTKGTGYFFAGPFVLMLLVRRGRWQHLLVAGAIALLINVGPFTRNTTLFHSPLGPIGEAADGEGFQVAAFTWNGAASNVVRNLFMQLATPFAPIDDALSDEVSWIHERLGIGIASPATSWPGTEFTRSTFNLTLHESTAANPLAILLIVVAVVFGVVNGVNRTLLVYGLAWALGFIGFSSILRWQPWGIRLMLPWLVLAGPIVGCVLERGGRQVRQWATLAAVLLVCAIPLILQRAQSASRRDLLGLLVVSGAIAVGLWLTRDRLDAGLKRLLARVDGRAAWLALNAALLAAALPWALANETRPLLGERSVLSTPRVTQMFVGAPEDERPYREATDAVHASGCTRVGLRLGFRSWDYPLFVLLRGSDQSEIHLEYVDVTNVSAALARSSFSPCALISNLEGPLTVAQASRR